MYPQQARIAQVLEAFAKVEQCRQKLAGIAQQIGAFPEIRRMVDDFTDRAKYKDRPQITLNDTDPSIYLLGWREGEFTKVHNHDGAEVAIVVLQGVITEDVFSTTPAEDQCLNICGSFTRIVPTGGWILCPCTYMHRMGNEMPELAVTLHVYGPTLPGMKVYDQHEGKLIRVDHWHNDQH
jgi:predicted metal-dependent enzyme (double-stranded beta helix superfamily)